MEELHELDKELKDIINIFKIVITSDIIKNPKPSTESIEYICNKLNLDREEIKLISLRTLFNKCVEDFNTLYYKFPYNVIVRIRKIDKRFPYAGVELKEAIEKELDNLVL